MIPSAFVSLVLLVACFRVYRLLAYDDFPPVQRIRAWVLGEYVSHGEYVQDTHLLYRRPLLAALVHCPFCLGFWISVLAYVAWLEWPAGTLYVAFPLALSGGVGIVTRQLDP